jgi:phospholipid-binding lipoprotein MlaA
LDVTDTRADLMTTEKVVNEGSIDRYDFIKNAYKQHREYLIHDGNPPNNDVDLEEEEASTTNSPASKTNGTTPAGATNTFNNAAMPTTNNTGSAPVINNSKHLLELSAPEEKK